MRIAIYPSDGEGPYVRNVDMQRAMVVLRAANIFLHGGGVVISGGSSIGVILLRHQVDHSRALEVLAKAGIKAS